MEIPKYTFILVRLVYSVIHSFRGTMPLMSYGNAFTMYTYDIELNPWDFNANFKYPVRFIVASFHIIPHGMIHTVSSLRSLELPSRCFVRVFLDLPQAP
jgi:hypothetical protein